MKFIAYVCARHAQFFTEVALTDSIDLPRFCAEYDCENKPEYEVVITPDPRFS